MKKNTDIVSKYVVSNNIILFDFLLQKTKQSRNNVKMLLANKYILVNGNLVTKYNFELVKDDLVVITKNKNESFKNNISKDKKKNYHIDIIYEDDDFIAINKPSGLLSVYDDSMKEENAFTFLFNYCKEKKEELYILHRIDKDTSGVLVFCKNKYIQSKLRLEWNNLVTKREYIAITENVIKKPEGVITSNISYDDNNLGFLSKDGKKAVTIYKVIKQSNKYQMVFLDIKTGRKNQIRIHLKSLGANIIGDTKYNGITNITNRLMLHAYKLEFKHPFEDKIISIKAKTPDLFYSFFKG